MKSIDAPGGSCAMSWFNWKDWYVKQAQDWTYVAFEPAQVPDKLQRRPLGRDAEYFTVTLQAMRIVNVRVGFKKFYGVVHSQVTANHASGTPAEFQVVTTPDFLRNVISKNLDRVLFLERNLCGPIPYRGGRVSLQTGLFAVQSADLAEPFVSLLTELSQTAGVSFLSQAVPYLPFITRGIGLLTGGSQATVLQIGLAREYTTLTTGWFAVIGASRGKIAADQLSISKDDNRIIDQTTGGAIADYPYMVFKIEGFRVRAGAHFGQFRLAR